MRKETEEQFNKRFSFEGDNYPGHTPKLLFIVHEDTTRSIASPQDIINWIDQNFTEKEEGCNCKEKSCEVPCKENHTHKGYVCEKCPKEEVGEGRKCYFCNPQTELEPGGITYLCEEHMNITPTNKIEKMDIEIPRLFHPNFIKLIGLIINKLNELIKAHNNRNYDK